MRLQPKLFARRRKQVEAGRGRAANQFIDNAAADAEAACLALHDHGPHFGNRPAERRQFRERDHFVVMDRDDEAIDVDEDFKPARAEADDLPRDTRRSVH